MIETYRITAQLVADLAWPLVVLLVIVVSLNRFPIEIGGLLRRVLGIKTPLVSADFVPPIQESVPSAIAPASSAEADLAQAQQAVTTALAYWRHEISYRQLYGTQIETLRFLNPRQDGASVDEIDQFYQRHLSLVRLNFPAYSYPRETYLNFLVNLGLMTPVTPDRYIITLHGTDFLAYFVTMKLADKVY